MSKLSLFTLNVNNGQQPPTLPMGFNQKCKMESILGNKVTLLVTMWMLVAHSRLQRLPASVDAVASPGHQNNTDRAKYPAMFGGKHEDDE